MKSAVFEHYELVYSVLPSGTDHCLAAIWRRRCVATLHSRRI